MLLLMIKFQPLIFQLTSNNRHEGIGLVTPPLIFLRQQYVNVFLLDVAGEVMWHLPDSIQFLMLLIRLKISLFKFIPNIIHSYFIGMN